MFYFPATQLALVFTATVTPFEVALLEPMFDPLFFTNRVVDVIFSIDVIIQFLTMTEKSTQSLTHGTVWVTEPLAIACNYIKSWFFLDVFAIAVSGFDVYAVIAQQISGEAPTDLSNLTILKTMRILRLFKLMRLLRTSRIAKRWETRMAIDYAMLSIFKCVVGVILASHWMACVWVLQAFIASPTPMPSWLGDDGYCIYDNTTSAGYTCQSATNMYMAAAYWSVMTITSVGYGDIAATPFNPTEQAVCIALMLVSSLIYAQVIGTYCGVVANLNPEATAFRETLDDLNRFMTREELPNEMRQRLREYFHQSKHLRLCEVQRGLLSHMPPSLKGEVSWQTNQSWLKKIWFLRNAPTQFMVELAMSLNALVYAPGDSPKVGFMYIVHRGVAIYRAKLICKGRVFGEDMILSSPHLRSNATAKAMNYLEVYYTGRRELLYLAQRYPKTLQAIRRAAVMIALRREIIMLAKVSMGIDPSEKISTAAKLMRIKESGGAIGNETKAQKKEAGLFGMGVTYAPGSAGVGDKVPDELPIDVDINDAFPISPAMSSSSMRRGSRHGSPNPGGGGGGMPGGAGGPFGGGMPMGGFSGGGGAVNIEQVVSLVTAAHRQEITHLKAHINSEIAAREEASKQMLRQQENTLSKVVELATQTAARVDEVLLRLARKTRSAGPVAASGVRVPRAGEGTVTQVTSIQSTTVVNDPRAITAEDRYQDGVAEPMPRARPRRRLRAPAGEAQPAGPTSVPPTQVLEDASRLLEGASRIHSVQGTPPGDPMLNA